MANERNKDAETSPEEETIRQLVAGWREMDEDAGDEVPDIRVFRRLVAETREREKAKARREWGIFLGAGGIAAGGALTALAAGWGWFAVYQGAAVVLAVAAGYALNDKSRKERGV